MMNFLSLIVPFCTAVLVIHTPVSARHISKRSDSQQPTGEVEQSENIGPKRHSDLSSSIVTDMYLDIGQNNDRFLVPMWLLYYKEIIENILIHQQMVGLISETQQQTVTNLNDETEHDYEFSAESSENDRPDSLEIDENGISDVPEIEENDMSDAHELAENEVQDTQEIEENKRSHAQEIAENEWTDSYEIAENEMQDAPEIEENERSHTFEIAENEWTDAHAITKNEMQDAPEIEENDTSHTPEIVENEWTESEIAENEWTDTHEIGENERIGVPGLQENKQKDAPEIEGNDRPGAPEISENDRSDTPKITENKRTDAAEIAENDRTDVAEIETIEEETPAFTENTDEQQTIEPNDISELNDAQEVDAEGQTEAHEVQRLHNILVNYFDQDNSLLESEQDEPYDRDTDLLSSSLSIDTGTSTLPPPPRESTELPGGLFRQLIQSAIDLMPTVTTSQTGANMRVFEQGDHQESVIPNDEFTVPNETDRMDATSIANIRDDSLISEDVNRQAESFADESDTNQMLQDLGQIVDWGDAQHSNDVNDDSFERVSGLANINDSESFMWRQVNDMAGDIDNGDSAEFVHPGSSAVLQPENSMESFELVDNDTDTSNT